jgi:hypothetical protein
MTKIKHGRAEIGLPDELGELPERAGTLTPKEVNAIPRARRGLGMASALAAEGIRGAGSALTLDLDLTPESIIEASARAESIDVVIADVEFLLHRLKQGNLLLDAEAYMKLRRLKDAVRTQGKYKPELLTMFAAFLSFFEND